MNERRKSRTKASFSHLHSTFTFSGKSRTKASLSHLALSLLFDGSLARQLRSHIFHFHFLRDVSHDSFVLTSCTFTFWGKSRTRAPFSYLPLSLFEGSFARKLRFHIFHVHFLRKVSHEMRFWKFAGARNAVFCRRKCVPEDGWGNLSGWPGAEHVSFQLGSCSDRPITGTDSSGVVLLTFLCVLLLWFATRPLQIAFVMAASRLPGVEAVCVILLSFAAGHGKSHWCGCIKAAIVICQQNFSILALVIFRFKIPFKKCLNIVFFLLWRRDPSGFGAGISDAFARSSIVFSMANRICNGCVKVAWRRGCACNNYYLSQLDIVLGKKVCVKACFV